MSSSNHTNTEPITVPDDLGSPASVIVILVIGVLFNVVTSYYVFYWKRFQWSCFKLMQHIIICNFIHIIIGGAHELFTADDVKSSFNQLGDCRLVYPIFTVTVNNPNLTTLTTFAFFLYNTRIGEKEGISISTVKALLVVGWILCLFLFAPQVFIYDLTQTYQTCNTPNMDVVLDGRISYWIGIFYFQINVLIITFICLFWCWYSCRKAQRVEVSTIATLLKSKYMTEMLDSKPRSGTVGGESDLGETRRQRTERYVMNQERRIVTFSDISDSGSSPINNVSDRCQRRCVRAMVQKQMQIARLVLGLIIVHILGMVPNNVFFFWYYFNLLEDVRRDAASVYTVTCPLSFMSVILSPLLFLLTHKRVRRHMWYVMTCRTLFNQRETLFERRGLMGERCRISRNNGILKETGF